MQDPIIQDRILRAAQAAEQLCSVLWEALQVEASAGHAHAVAAISERLAEVSRSVAVLATAGGGPPDGEQAWPEGRREAVQAADGPASKPAQARHGDFHDGGDAGSRRGEQGLQGPASREAAWPSRAPAQPAGEPEGPSHSSPRLRHDAAWPAAEPAWPGREPSTGERREDVAYRPDRPPSEEAAEAACDGGAALIDEREPTLRVAREIRPQYERDVGPPAIEVRDVRRSEPSAWQAAVQRRLERFAEDGTPFSLLLVEVLDAVRLQLAQPPEEAGRLTHEIETAMAGVLRPADCLLREATGRYGLIAPDTGAAAARSLAEQLAAAVGSSASHRGVPLRLTVGIAVCPEHGRDAHTLMGHADMDLYAAQAAGRSVGGFDGGTGLG